MKVGDYIRISFYHDDLLKTTHVAKVVSIINQHYIIVKYENGREHNILIRCAELITKKEYFVECLKGDISHLEATPRNLQLLITRYRFVLEASINFIFLINN